MLQLDDNFLKDLGITDLPDDQKQALLQHIYEELELRVGEELAKGLSDKQMAEFEKILDQDESTMHEWLQTNVPDYEHKDDFKQIVAAAQGQGQESALSPDQLSQYVSMKWLEVNRPDYKKVVAAVMEEMKQEIIKNRDAILAKQDQ